MNCWLIEKAFSTRASLAEKGQKSGALKNTQTLRIRGVGRTPFPICNN